MVLIFGPSLLLSIVLSLVLTMLLKVATIPAMLIGLVVFVVGIGLTRMRI